MESRKGLTWRSAVVPVAARGVAQVGDQPAQPPAPADNEAWLSAVDELVAWCQADEGPLWLVEGPSGAGKTRLANEVAFRLSAHGWPCGWARPGLGGFAVTAAARNGRRALILVDDAETRADLGELLRSVAGGGTALPVRIILLARQYGPWWRTLFGRLSPAEQEALRPRRRSLGGGMAQRPSPRALALRTLDLATTGDKQDALALLAAADPATGAVLLRQAALVVALSTRVGQLDAAEARAALRDLFEEEEGYWRRAAAQVATGQSAPSLRTALATSAVVGDHGLTEAATALRRVPALAVGAADRLARLAVWWHGLYARTGEAAATTARLPAWLADRLPENQSTTTGVAAVETVGTTATAGAASGRASVEGAGGGRALMPRSGPGTQATVRAHRGEPSAVSWTVAALDAERRVTSTLSRLALNAHRDIWPNGLGDPQASEEESAVAHTALRRGVDASAPVDEALAWLAHDLQLSDSELDSLSDAINYPTRSLTRTAIVLAKRLVETADGEGDRAAFLLSLGARHSELGEWAEASGHTQVAIATLRALVEHDRPTHLPDLANAVGNLATCLTKLGEDQRALAAAYEAVALQRELTDADRDRYLPALARALVTLSACLSRDERAAAAAGVAGEAVAIYRELVQLHSEAYEAELAAADHNWRVCHEAMAPVPSA